MANFKEEFKDVVDVDKVGVFSFGGSSTEEVDLKKLMFAAGANMFSSCCGFKFISKVNPTYNHGEFRIVFCVKLRSKIGGNTASIIPSKWFAWIRINNNHVEVLDKEKCMQAFDFDVDKFFETDFFRAWAKKFEFFVKRGLKMWNTWLKQHPDMKKNNSMDDHFYDYPRYVKSISDSIPLISSPVFNDKTFTLRDGIVKGQAKKRKANVNFAKYLAKKDAENREAKKVQDVLDNMPSD